MCRHQVWRHSILSFHILQFPFDFFSENLFSYWLLVCLVISSTSFLMFFLWWLFLISVLFVIFYFGQVAASLSSANHFPFNLFWSFSSVYWTVIFCAFSLLFVYMCVCWWLAYDIFWFIWRVFLCFLPLFLMFMWLFLFYCFCQCMPFNFLLARS